jgi:hypothetical protein
MVPMGFEPRLIYVCTTPCHRLALGWCHEEHEGNIGGGLVAWFLDFCLFPFPLVEERLEDRRRILPRYFILDN